MTRLSQLMRKLIESEVLALCSWKRFYILKPRMQYSKCFMALEEIITQNL